MERLRVFTGVHIAVGSGRRLQRRRKIFGRMSMGRSTYGIRICFGHRRNGYQRPCRGDSRGFRFYPSSEFNEGSQPSTVENIHALRGLMTNWPNASLIRKVCFQTIDALLAHCDATGVFAPCADPEIMTAFWPTFQFSKELGRANAIWPTRPSTDMRRVLEARNRLSCPQEGWYVLWITFHATMERVGRVNWDGREFIQFPVVGLLRCFNGPNTSPPTISDIELASSAAREVVCDGTESCDGGLGELLCSLRITKFVSVGPKRQRPGGPGAKNLARFPTSAYSIWGRSYAFLYPIASKYFCDLGTRVNKVEPKRRIDRFEMTQMQMPWWRGGLGRFGNVARWNSASQRLICRSPKPLRGADVLNVVGRNGSNSTGCWVARKYGCNLSMLAPAMARQLKY